MRKPRAEPRRCSRRPLIASVGTMGTYAPLSWDESVRLDLRYVENWSFALDLQILWKSINLFARGSGAY